MSCGRVSLLTNVTREPAVTVTFFGDTPLAVIVIVAADGAAGSTAATAPPDGPVPGLPLAAAGRNDERAQRTSERRRRESMS